MLHIRQAEVSDIPCIMNFINEHWRKGHIMGNNRTLFEFQHREGNQVHYIIAEDDEDGKIYGTMGYIPMNHTKYPTISTMMIRVLKHKDYERVGEEISKWVRQNMPYSNEISPGMKKKYALAVSVLAEECVGKMKQYYRLQDKEKYQIAVIRQKEILPVEGAKQKSGAGQTRDKKSKKDKTVGELCEICSFEQFQKAVSEKALESYIPYRDYGYIRHRYFEHPYYTYRFYHICYEKPTESVLIAREIAVNDVKILRVIDYVGKDGDLAGIGNAVDKLLEKNDYEYIDFFCYGISDEIMRQAGFSVIEDNDENIIPNYFEPFEQKNAELYFYTWSKKGIHVFKGFGDQDRPNII